ncbi:hypothetical protein NIES2101_13315 [Calothrix sp. HK-06]|nr:hypothetical protein NIES2101_13315 [Calothrix sp. HK-06]
MIKKAETKDREGILEVIQAVGLFTAPEVEFMSGLVDSFLNGEQEDSHYWVVAEKDGVQGVGYYGPENFAQEVYNLYFIGVKPDKQGQGVGASLVKFIENHLHELKQRILLVETSGLPEFEKTRQFYLKQGFVQEAVVREYYKAGDDKVIFWKKLN